MYGNDRISMASIYVPTQKTIMKNYITWQNNRQLNRWFTRYISFTHASTNDFYISKPSREQYDNNDNTNDNKNDNNNDDDDDNIFFQSNSNLK